MLERAGINKGSILHRVGPAEGIEGGRRVGEQDRLLGEADAHDVLVFVAVSFRLHERAFPRPRLGELAAHTQQATDGVAGRVVIAGRKIREAVGLHTDRGRRADEPGRPVSIGRTRGTPEAHAKGIVGVRRGNH